jgi:flavin reductase (DIM6/NTAB) family NADH-FMN oxidoreductase RutF
MQQSVAGHGRTGLSRARDSDARDGELRACLSRFATGVTIVTFAGPQGPHGLTVSSFTSVSMRPPLVLVCIARTARSHDELVRRPFCVNVLSAHQEDLARRFAGGQDASAGVSWAAGHAGPCLDGALAHLECRPWRTYDGGDHTIVVGEVTGFRYRDGDALAYLTSRFTTLAEPRLGMEYLL